MAPRARTPAPNLLDLPPVPGNHLVQLTDFAVLDHVSADLQHAPGAGIEGILHERELPPGVIIVLERHLFV